MLLVIFVVQLTALYFFSRWVTKSLFVLLLIIFRARSVAISLLLLLTFPGTVIHELSHLFTAEILRVPTGKLTLVPENIREERIKSGSVAIAETDPFRRYAIGLAPIFWGVTTIAAIAYLLTEPYSNITIITILLYYLLFAVSNSMFSSPEDLRGFIPFAIALGIFTTGGYLLGLRFELIGQALEVAMRTLTTLTNSLTIVLAVNIGLLGASWGLTKALSRLFGLRITRLR